MEENNSRALAPRKCKCCMYWSDKSDKCFFTEGCESRTVCLDPETDN